MLDDGENFLSTRNERKDIRTRKKVTKMHRPSKAAKTYAPEESEKRILITKNKKSGRRSHNIKTKKPTRTVASSKIKPKTITKLLTIDPSKRVITFSNADCSQSTG